MAPHYDVECFNITGCYLPKQLGIRSHYRRGAGQVRTPRIE
jgi:hypothetical protein